MRKKIKLIEEIIENNSYGSDTIILFSNNSCLHTLLCNKKNNKYCVEIETDTNTSLIWYDMKKKEDVDDVLEVLYMKFN